MLLDPNSGHRPQTEAEWRDARATRRLAVFLLVMLVAVALWPLAVVYDWFTAGHRFPDPIGFTSAVMFVRPLIAAAAALSCPIVLVLVVTSHPQQAFSILVKAGLAVGMATLAILLLTPLTNSFLADWIPRVQSLGGSPPGVPVTEIIARENAAALSAIVPLVGIAIAFAGIAALSRSARPSTMFPHDLTAPDLIVGPSTSGGRGPGPSAEDGRLRDVPPQPPSAAADSFNQLTYRVRARPSFQGWLPNYFSDYYSDYEIRGHAEHFSYSMRTGLLRREADGAVLFSITRRADSLAETLQVVDSETGAPVGSFRSRVNGWDIDDALGRPVLFVVREVEERFRVRYVASADGGEVCRYAWSFGLLGLFNAGLEIEIAQDGPAFDRALAVALGPFIEEEAWLVSRELRRLDGD